MNSRADGLGPITGRLLRPTVSIAVIGLVSALLGFGREVSVARAFGTSREADAFYTSLFIPTLAYNLLVAGTLSSAMIPTLSRRLTWPDRSEFRSITTILLASTALVTIAAAAIGRSFTGPIVHLIAPGLPGPTAADAERLLRALIFLLPLFATSGVLAAALNASKQFVVASLAPMFFSVGIIIAANLPHANLSIDTIAAGALLGATAQTMLLGVVLVRRGLVALQPGAWPLTALKEIAWLAIPVLASLIIGQIALIVERVLASGLPIGTLASLNYSQRLVQLPASVLVTAVATVMLPHMSTDQLRGNLLRQSLDGVFFVMAPAVAIVVAISTPLVVLLFKHGAFGASAVSLTAGATALYIVGQLPYAVSLVATRGLYARNGGLQALANAIVWSGLNIIFDLVLVGPFGLMGLAAGSSMAGVIGLFVVLFSARSVGHTLDWTAIGRSWGAMALAAGLAMAVGSVASQAADLAAGPFAACVAGVIAAGSVYIWILRLLRAQIIVKVAALRFATWRVSPSNPIAE